MGDKSRDLNRAVIETPPYAVLVDDDGYYIVDDEGNFLVYA